eukprot:m51a1_g8470 putative heat shock protein 70 family member (905) ;mRNA; f:481637-484866
MKQAHHRTGALGLLALAALAGVAAAAVVGIDLGAELTGSALLRANGFLVVLDERSDRVSPSAVGWNQNDERVYADSAVKALAKVPHNVVTYPVELLGRKTTHPALRHAAALAPYAIVEGVGERAAARVVGRGGEGTARVWNGEEAQAMLLRRQRKLIAGNAGSPIKDVVLTVGPWTTEHERRALIDSAKLAGLNVQSLLNTPVSFAVAYAIERATNGTQRMAFVDMGAASFKVALVTITLTFDKRNKSSTTLLINDLQWDTEAGGRDMDDLVARHLLAELEPAWGKEAASDPRLRQRVLRTVAKTREVLSANKESLFKIESVAGDRDYDGKMTREQFNAIIAPVVDRIEAPIRRALARANWTTDMIDRVQIVGGLTRVPLVQERLMAVFNTSDLARHVSGDEGAMFGAAYVGAHHSSSFRMPEFHLKDISPYGTIASSLGFEAQLFKPGQRLGSKKTITISSNADLFIDVSYDKPSFLLAGGAGGCRAISRYRITGVPTEADHNLTDTPKINAYFRLSSSNLIELDRAEAEISVIQMVEETLKKEKKDDKNASDKDKKEEATKEAKADEKPAADKAEEKPADKAAEKPAEGKTAEEKAAEEEKPVKVLKPVKRIHRITLKVERESQCVKDLTPEQLKKMGERLDELDAVDAARIERGEAMNKLESFVYQTRHELEADAASFEAVAAPGELEALQQSMSEAHEWLEDNAETATTQEFRDKLKPMSKVVDRLKFLHSEADLRAKWPEFVPLVAKTLRESLANVSALRDVTENETKKVSAQIDEFEAWFESKSREQTQKKAHEDPAYTSSDVEGFLKDLQASVRLLSLRPVKKPPQPEKKPEEAKPEKEAAEPEATEDAEPQADGVVEEQQHADKAAENKQEAQQEAEQQEQQPDTEDEKTEEKTEL